MWVHGGYLPGSGRLSVGSGRLSVGSGRLSGWTRNTGKSGGQLGNRKALQAEQRFHALVSAYVLMCVSLHNEEYAPGLKDQDDRQGGGGPNYFCIKPFCLCVCVCVCVCVLVRVQHHLGLPCFTSKPFKGHASLEQLFNISVKKKKSQVSQLSYYYFCYSLLLSDPSNLKSLRNEAGRVKGGKKKKSLTSASELDDRLNWLQSPCDCVVPVQPYII